MEKTHNWFPLFSTNLLTVFNDNYLKWLVCFISIKWVTTVNESTIISIASAMLVLPFIFLSPLAGRLSVCYRKRDVLIVAKIVEIPIIIIGVLGFVSHSIYMVMSAVLMLGIQSSLLSPSKYGLIRDVGGEKGISYGTGSMEMLTFFGVLLGTFIASVISDHYNLVILIIIGVTIAIIGLITAILIKVDESEPDKTNNDSINPATFMIHSFKQAQSIPGLNYIILGLSFFWLVGALLQMNLKVYCPQVLGLSDIETGIIMVVAAIGIGAGCFFTGIISRHTVKLHLVPIGASGMILFLVSIFTFQPGTIIFAILIFLTAFFSGIFKVPLNSWIQANVKGRLLGDMLAYENVCEFLFILCSSLIFFLFDTRTVFIVLTLLTLFITILIIFKIPGMYPRKKE